MTLTFGEAKELASKARDPYAGKPLQNNTRLHERENYKSHRTYYAVRLHATDVVQIHPGNRYVLDTGGWDTVTTWDRINTYAPGSWRHRFRDKGVMYYRLRSSENDPEPEYPSRTVLKPYVAADPGPEPVKSSEGCWVGQRHVKTTSRRDFVKPERATVRELATYEGPSSYRTYRRRHGESGVRSRDLVHWLKGVEIDLESYPGLYLITQATKVVEYVESANYWNRQQSNVELVTCPHCEQFAQQHARWNLAMNGGWRAGHGYATYVEYMERYGSKEAWHEAWKQDGREVRAGQAAWREWSERNRVEFSSGITIDSEGYPLKTSVERAQRAQRKRAREIKRADREHMKRLRAEERERKAALKKWRESTKDFDLSAIEEQESGFLAHWKLVPHRRDGELMVTLYKGVTKDGKSGFMSTNHALYEPGKWTVAPDYTPDRHCGHGLHFGPTPKIAVSWSGDGRTLLVEVPLRSLRAVTGANKCKAERCYVVGEWVEDDS